MSDRSPAIRYDVYEARVVTSDGHFVSLRRGAGGWDSNMLREYWAFGGDVGKQKAERFAKERYGARPTEAQKNQILEIRANGWLHANAKKYGYIFKEDFI